MGKNKQKYTYWNIPVTKTFNELVEKAVKEIGYVSKSEFVRDSVRKMLVNLGFLGLKKKKKGGE